MRLEDLTQAWLHSHEEDSDGTMVFRPESFPFPPSRGRTGFTLNQDGNASLTGPSPVDATESASGSWSMSKQDRLRIQSQSGETREFEVVELNPDKLVLKSA